MKGAFEEYVLNAKVELILKENLEISKKRVFKFFIDDIKQRIELTSKAILNNFVDTRECKNKKEDFFE